LHFTGLYSVYRKAPRLAKCSKQINIAGTFTAETKIIANNQMANPETVNEIFSDKILGRRLRQFTIETQRKYLINPGSLQFLNLVSPAQKSRRSILRAEKLVGMRLERHYRGTRPKPTGLFPKDVYQARVPQMYAVVVTNRYHRRAVRGTNVI
jgi:hypothetical protein